MIEISEMELSIIKNMMLRKSHRYISAALDLPQEEITRVISIMTEGSDILTWQMKLDRRPKVTKQIKPKRKSFENDFVKPNRKSKPDQEAERYHSKRLKDLEKKKIPTLVIDWNQRHSLKVDKNTFIVLKPGEDPEAAKKAYEERAAIKKKNIYSMH